MTHGYTNILGEERIQVSLFETGDATLDAVLTDWFFGTVSGGQENVSVALAQILLGTQSGLASAAGIRGLTQSLGASHGASATAGANNSLTLGQQVVQGGLAQAGDSLSLNLVQQLLQQAVAQAIAANSLGAGQVIAQQAIAQATGIETLALIAQIANLGLAQVQADRVEVIGHGISQQGDAQRLAETTLNSSLNYIVYTDKLVLATLELLQQVELGQIAEAQATTGILLNAVQQVLHQAASLKSVEEYLGLGLGTTVLGDSQAGSGILLASTNSVAISVGQLMSAALELFQQVAIEQFAGIQTMADVSLTVTQQALYLAIAQALAANGLGLAQDTDVSGNSQVQGNIQLAIGLVVDLVVDALAIANAALGAGFLITFEEYSGEGQLVPVEMGLGASFNFDASGQIIWHPTLTLIVQHMAETGGEANAEAILPITLQEATETVANAIAVTGVDADIVGAIQLSARRVAVTISAGIVWTSGENRVLKTGSENRVVFDGVVEMPLCKQIIVVPIENRVVQTPQDVRVSQVSMENRTYSGQTKER